jgi:histidyl-tRNA synthetase
MKKIIEPKILKGTRDFGPEAMIKRNFVMEKLKTIFKQFGFDQIETPVIEYAETILGKYGEEGDKLTYTFKDRGDRQIALPYDLTVPFARFTAANWQNLAIPFKRFQISRVWRADKPQKGRLREFYQCDVDVIGTESLLAEAEISSLMYKVFSSFGFKKFTIRFNSRKVINAILNQCGYKEEQHIDVIRVVDKFDKIGAEEVEKEILVLDKDNSKVEKLMKYISMTGTNKEKIKKCDFPEVKEVKEFLDYVKYYNIPEENLMFDLKIARGLDYYTGIVFEVTVDEPKVGTLCAGGRYANLCGYFCDKKFSGTGVSFGFERLMIVMDELGLLSVKKTNTDVLVTVFDKNSLGKSIEILNKLQAGGLNAELYIQEDRLGQQFKYADKKGVEYVVVCGPDEIKKDVVVLKDLKTGKQKEMTVSAVLEELKG